MVDDLEGLPVDTVSEQVNQDKKKSGVVRFALDLLETLVLSLLLFVVINTFTARIRVDGHSMEPTLHNGDYVIINKMAYKFGKPQIGDVVVFHFPRDPEQEYIKRVIGLPGDEVVISNKQVMVNGKILDEPYIAADPNYEYRHVVPEGTLFVLGDNRNNSSDSHNWGPVPLENVIGKAVLVYWPPSDWSLIEHSSPMITP